MDERDRPDSGATFFGTAVASGILTGLSFPSFHWYPLIWVALIPLFLPALRHGPRRCFLRFFVAGMVFYLILLQWLLCNIYWAGGWAIGGYVALCAFMALYWGCLGGLWAWVRDRCAGLPLALVTAILWTAMEFLQGRLFSGFGWGALGYVHSVDRPLLQLASVGGVGLLSALTVAFNVAAAQIVVDRAHRVVRTSAAVALLVLSHALGWALLHPPDYESRPFVAGLVQSNFPQEVKWDPEYAMEMVEKTAARSRDLINTSGVDLLVWPEALIVTPLDSPGLMARIAALTHEAEAPLFTGVSRFVPEAGGWANSSCLFTQQGEIMGYYDKIRLAPFGEYAPFSSYLPFLTKLIPAIGEMVPGRTLKVFAVGERRFGPLICFEVLFPDMAERLRRNSADFLVVITNLAWFGASNAIPQELEISRVRAVETRLPLVHCANTGYSGVFDPYGRFSAIGETHVRTFGAVPVAAPARRVFQTDPQVFSKACLGISCIWLAAILLRKTAARATSKRG